MGAEQMEPTQLKSWQSRSTFFFTLLWATLGIGGIWRTGALAAEHGGGLFWLCYVFFLITVGLPVLVAEAAVGRSGRASVTESIGNLSLRSGDSSRWEVLGLLAASAALLTLLSLLMLVGWVVPYALDLFGGHFAGVSLLQAGEYYEALEQDSELRLSWSLAAIGLSGIALFFGVKRGVGSLAWIAVPSIITLSLLLLRHSFLVGDVQAAGAYLFQTRWDQFGLASLIHALMQAVMTLLVGFGVATTYSAFASDHLPLGRALGAIAVFDMAFALLAALIIFPVLFAQALLPSMGPSLLFIAIPQAYGSSVEGDFMGGLLMLVVLLLLFGVIVALAQVLVSIVSHRTKLGQRASCAICVVLVALLLYGAYHLQWHGVRLNSWILIALTDRLITTLLVPLITFGLCVLVGWRAYRKGLLMALDRESRFFLVAWIFLLRYVVPFGSVVLLVLGWLVYQ